MATQLTIQNGLTVTPTANAADATGNYIVPTGSALARGVNLRFTNGGGSSINVVMDDVASTTPESATSFNPDVTLPVPNGASRYFRITDIGRFRDPTTGRINWTYSVATSVTVEVIEG